MPSRITEQNKIAREKIKEFTEMCGAFTYAKPRDYSIIEFYVWIRNFHHNECVLGRTGVCSNPIVIEPLTDTQE